MYFPFSTLAGGITRPHRTIDAAANRALLALRTDSPTAVEVRYMRHPVATIEWKDMRAMPFETAERYVLNRINAGIDKLGESPKPAVQGKNKRAVVAILTELGVADPEAGLAQLRPYLK